jgi:hypothetical protein
MTDVPDLDTEHPNPARMYDFYLGGMHNFEVDRRAARAAEAAWPGTACCARANRSFLRRAVRYLAAERGIDQFLDLGSGVPTVGNIHEVAQAVNPSARVVYVDNEPVAVKASEILLADQPTTAVVRADLRDPSVVLGSPQVAALLDLSRPVAVMLVSVLPFVPDADGPERVVRSYLDAVPAGSCLTISHYDDSSSRGADAARIAEVYENTTNPFTLRGIEAIRRLFAGTVLVEPGLVHVLDWRPGDDTSLEAYRDRIPLRAGVGLKT